MGWYRFDVDVESGACVSATAATKSAATCSRTPASAPTGPSSSPPRGSAGPRPSASREPRAARRRTVADRGAAGAGRGDAAHDGRARDPLQVAPRAAHRRRAAVTGRDAGARLRLGPLSGRSRRPRAARGRLTRRAGRRRHGAAPPVVAPAAATGGAVARQSVQPLARLRPSCRRRACSSACRSPVDLAGALTSTGSSKSAIVKLTSTFMAVDALGALHALGVHVDHDGALAQVHRLRLDPEVDADALERLLELLELLLVLRLQRLDLCGRLRVAELLVQLGVARAPS